jgi:multicomponent K+:H+ antiporter subunit C
MLWLFAGSIGLLMGAGTYLVLRARGFTVALGLMLITYATNLFVFATGGLQTGQAPVDTSTRVASNSLERMADPLPQALVLTAIVIGFAMTALMLALVLRAFSDLGSEHVDAHPCDTVAGETQAGRIRAKDHQASENETSEPQTGETQTYAAQAGKAQP